MKFKILFIINHQLIPCSKRKLYKYSHKPEANKYDHYYITVIWKFSPIVRNRKNKQYSFGRKSQIIHDFRQILYQVIPRKSHTKTC